MKELNALPRLRHRALPQGRTVSIRGAGPEVARLLAMTRTRPLLTPTQVCPGGWRARSVGRPA
ncbi:hypothetical protein ACFYZ9_39085 [Streptomyces sp. NPDC001691]|uniref:hypothetical protein n=1 Tax=Streptomyces sp. NPDC001691 TaxID=3364600 RepID=UPI003686A4EA